MDPAPFLKPLQHWARSGECRSDLESIFGDSLDWSAAHALLERFRDGDFSALPPVHRLPACDMPGLWGGYSREKRTIFLSQACPQDRVSEALIEEIGHFLDQELCELETPGDEGALFARAVLGFDPEATFVPDSRAARARHQGAWVAVEAMAQRISQSRAGEILRGTSGSDTFEIYNSDVEIQDYLPSTDWISATTDIDLSKFAFITIENLFFTDNKNYKGIGNSKANSIVGGGGNDFLDGGTGNDTLEGGAGNDTLVGIAGTDVLSGGAGNDVYYVESLATSILEDPDGGYDVIYTTNRNIVDGTFENVEKVFYISNPGPPTGGDSLSLFLTGTNNADNLIGSSAADTIMGMGGNDVLTGNGGHDSLNGGTGNDQMVGGTGNDTYVVDSAGDSIVENSNEGTDLVIASVTYTLPSGVEHLTQSGTLAIGGSHINATGNTLANSITGNQGNNVLNGGGGNDTLLGGGGNDMLLGGDGNDRMDGGSGVNTLDGGAGSDVYIINDRNDRIINETATGGTDSVRTRVNFDPIQGSAAFDPFAPDNSPSGSKAPSFASLDPASFYNLENFYLLDQANYGVGNALNNIMAASDATGGLLLGMGGSDTITGRDGNDSLFGDTPRFYAKPDLYATAPADTRTQAFLNGVIGSYASDLLDGGGGDDYLDGGRGSDTMIGGAGDDTFVQDHVDDVIEATVLTGESGQDELVSSIDVHRAPTGINDIMLVVKDQDRDADRASITGQEQVAKIASFLDATGGNKGSYTYGIGTVSVGVANANRAELMYSYNEGDVYRSNRTESFHRRLNVGARQVDVNDNTKVAYELAWSAGRYDASGVVGYTVRYRQNSAQIGDLVLTSKISNTDQQGGLDVEFIDPGAANRTLKITASGRKITVELATNASSLITTTQSQFATALASDSSASALLDVRLTGAGTGVLQANTSETFGVWKTYLDGTAQDLRGTQSFPSLKVDNLDRGTYEFEVVSNRLAMPVVRYFNESDLDPGENPANFTIGQALREQVVTLQGGAGNDFLTAQKLVYDLPGGLANDAYTNPLLTNNPLNPMPLGFVFAPEPLNPNAIRQTAFAAYLDGGAGNDLLVSAEANGGLGVDYEFQGITFSGLNTMVGGQGSDTFVVKNGGRAFGDSFDHVVKFGNETPVNYGAGGVGASLNGGQHNLVISAVPYLTLSDTIVSQGKFIDQLVLSGAGQFAMGNRLDNFIADGLNGGGGSGNTLVGGVGRDSIRGGAERDDVLIGGTAYGVDNVGLAIKDFASVVDGGNGLTNSIFRDTDPIPVGLNGPGFADPSQFWFVPGYYGEVFDPARNRDTLVAADASTLDGGAGNDSLVGSSTPNSRGDNFFVSRGPGGIDSQNILINDAVFGNGGNDTVTFTDSDYLWWSGHQERDILAMNGYTIAGDISNLVLQMGAPTARNGTGNRTSTGNENLGSNLIVGNEFDNILNGRGVGGQDQTGAGIDTLTGDGGLSGLLGADNFIIDSDGNSYRNSTSNVWNPSIKSERINDVPPPLFQHDWDILRSDYRDFDFVVITDFETIDTLTLGSNASQYSIGNLPLSLSSPGSLVGPRGSEFTSNEFGIYFTGATYGSVNPNLVAVIQSTNDLLGTLQDNDGDGFFDGLTPRPLVNDSITTGSGVPPPLMGWGEFYALDSTPFAAFVNRPYVQTASTASLSDLINRIV